MQRDYATEPATWECILAYANDQACEAAAGRGPSRTSDVEERYRRYKLWCTERQHTGVELVLATSIWRDVELKGRPLLRVALEPNIVPYHCSEGIEHWVLWYHPDRTSPDTDLPQEQIHELVLTFLQLTKDELVGFQNLPQFRSVPEMAHAHVFLRPCEEASKAALRQLRDKRRLRSPWCEAERLSGRGAEVGYDEEKGSHARKRKQLHVASDLETMRAVTVPLSLRAMGRACCKHSRYQVGACLMSADGRTFTGINVELDTYGLMVCAERTALFKALSEGATGFVHLACSTKDAGISCGACRQLLAEYCNADMPVEFTDNKGQVGRSTTVAAMLPDPFVLSKE
jgi:cytidine deaminase